MHLITYDLKGVRDYADGHQLLAIVTTVHHERVCEAFDDGALCLAESLRSISAGGVGDVDWGANLDVIAELNISYDTITCQEVRLTSKRCRESRHPRTTTC